MWSGRSIALGDASALGQQPLDPVEQQVQAEREPRVLVERLFRVRGRNLRERREGAGRDRGMQITPGFLLLAAVVAEVPIAMVVLSLLLPQRTARWANIAAVGATIAYVLGMGSATPHYVFIAGLETVACLAIAWWSWAWRPAEHRLPTATFVTE